MLEIRLYIVVNELFHRASNLKSARATIIIRILRDLLIPETRKPFRERKHYTRFCATMIKFLISTARFFLLFAAVTAAEEWKIGQGVSTTSGLVSGRPSTLKGTEQVSEYLGIPYAAPPVGPLRWRPPQPFKGNGSLAATAWGPSCPQSAPPEANGGAGPAGNNMSEDCLSLNVWTKPQTGEKKKAVLVSIYGGGFNIGTSKTPDLIGSALADREDVVVVSMNYRLNIFGFPGATSAGFKEQNFGMLDIRAAVEWVRDNIAAFGGDPKRITLFGESAGGGATDYYAFGWKDDPIVHGVIPMSGSVFTRGIAAAENNDAWFRASSGLGCGGAEAGEQTLKCMMEKNWKDVLKFVQSGMRVPGKTFGPIFDEKIIFKDYSARARAGFFAKVVGRNSLFLNVIAPLN
jgi:cholinesterase